MHALPYVRSLHPEAGAVASSKCGDTEWVKVRFRDQEAYREGADSSNFGK
jgi:hypothetical protein